MNRALVSLLGVVTCAEVISGCQSNPGITRVSTTSAMAASTSRSIPPTAARDADDPVKRLHDMFRSLRNPVIAATQDGTGSYDIKVPPQPSATGKGAHIGALCTGGPNVNITLDSTPVPVGGICGDDPGKPGSILMLLAVKADPSVAHTIKVQGADGQHSWVSLAYGSMY
ncbi:hypothetical protein FZI91_14515 [Mycobacterium sp. CBMA271]|uniref:hypothetical protein n=1 Tax=unclassified Mycobacteroides TaxID=2618759 RepID=UPI0012DDF1D8|nr:MULTISPECIES: hypothetical protein [unclassified Mycobacteroides]MUM16701.1 hypothetical protein [Mycobacteroides sp. CBMA 326]MUM22912.1 hypothetical protein [Mycobacteroides sp. CBMA 271]